MKYVEENETHFYVKKIFPVLRAFAIILHRGRYAYISQLVIQHPIMDFGIHAKIIEKSTNNNNFPRTSRDFLRLLS
jgi:hypothetical protein